MATTRTTVDCSGVAVILQERRLAALYNVPPTRLNLVTSPYPQYTPSQLAMRRKAEILKYASTTQSTQTNNLTKKQQWAQLVRGASSVARSASQIAQANLVQCTQTAIANLATAPTWTTACDVPGPPQLLQLDPAVPLYQYAPNLPRAFAIDPPPQTPWTFVPAPTAAPPPYQPDRVGHGQPQSTLSLGTFVFTQYASPNTAYVLPTLQAPLGLYVTDASGGTNTPSQLTLSVTNLGIQILYHGMEVPPAAGTIPTPTVVPSTTTSVVLGGNVGGMMPLGSMMLVIQGLAITALPSSVFEVQGVVEYSYTINTTLPGIQTEVVLLSDSYISTS